MSQTTHAFLLEVLCRPCLIWWGPPQGLLAQWLFLSPIWELGADLSQAWGAELRYLDMAVLAGPTPALVLFFFFGCSVHAVLLKLWHWSQDGTVGLRSHTPGVRSLLSEHREVWCWEGLAQPPQRCWSFAGTEFVYLCITFLSSVYSREGDIGT